MKKRKIRKKTLKEKFINFGLFILGIILYPFNSISSDKKKKQIIKQKNDEVDFRKDTKDLISEVELYLKRNKIALDDEKEIKDLIKYAKGVLAKDNLYLIKKAKEKIDMKFFYIKNKIYVDETIKTQNIDDKKQKESTPKARKEVQNKKEHKISIVPIISFNTPLLNNLNSNKSVHVNTNLKSNNYVLKSKPKLFVNGKAIPQTKTIIDTKFTANKRNTKTTVKKTSFTPVSITSKSTVKNNISLKNANVGSAKKTGISTRVSTNSSANRKVMPITTNTQIVVPKIKFGKKFFNKKFREIYLISTSKVDNLYKSLMISLRILLIKDTIYEENKKKDLRKNFVDATTNIDLAINMINSALGSINIIERYLYENISINDRNTNEFKEIILYIERVRLVLEEELSFVNQNDLENKKVLKKHDN